MISQDILSRLYARRRFGIKPGLDMVNALLDRLGNPHLDLVVVHIAGTNGKGSVCAMIDSILRTRGLRTGLYTSPHLVDLNERIKISGVNISDDDLSILIPEVEDAARNAAVITGRDATFFEFVTAVAFHYLRRKGVQIAVIETGMGGRCDATNIVSPIVSVITRISLEHMKYLGPDLRSIAGEKSGIIKDGRPVVCGAMESDALEVIRNKARSVDSDFYDATENINITKVKSRDISGQKVSVESMSQSYGVINLPLLGVYQLENMATSITAIEVLGRTMDIEFTADVVKKGLSGVTWPARFQVLMREPCVILDVAHNPGAAAALAGSIRQYLGSLPLGLITGICDDKAVSGFLSEFNGMVNKFWAVPLNNIRGLPAGQLAAAASSMGWDVCTSTLAKAVDEAIEWARSNNGVVCIAGSLFLAGEVLGDRRWQNALK